MKKVLKSRDQQLEDGVMVQQAAKCNQERGDALAHADQDQP